MYEGIGVTRSGLGGVAGERVVEVGVLIVVVVGEEVSGEEEDGEGEDGEEEAEGSATNIDEEIKKIQEQMKQGTKRQTSKAGGGRAKKPKAGGGK